MKVETIAALRSHITFTDAEVEALIELGRHHYDSACKEQAALLEKLLKNERHFRALLADDPSCVDSDGPRTTVTVLVDDREFQTLLKTLEMAHCVTSDDAPLLGHLRVNMNEAYTAARAVLRAVVIQTYEKEFTP